MLADKLGLPNIAGRRRLAVAVAVDSLGSGLFMPFSVIYFVEAGRVPLVSVGAALSLAALVAAAAGPLGGPLIDRLGARNVIVLSNLMRAAAFLAYPAADYAGEVAALATVVAWGDNVFWPATGTLTTTAADPGQRTRWFAMNRTLQNVGLGLGGLLAGVLVSSGGESGYQALVIVNAVSFLCAAVLVGSWVQDGTEAVSLRGSRTARRTGGYRAVIRDHGFVLLVAANTLFALCHLTLTILLPVYLTTALGGPSWLAGMLFGLNTVLVVIAQMGIGRLTENCDRVVVLRLAATAWTVSFVTFALLSLVPRPGAWWGAGAAVVVFTIAEMAHLPTSNALVAEMGNDGLHGRYMSFNQLSWSIAGILGPITFTGLLAWGAVLPWLVLVGCCLLALVLLRLVAHRRSPPEGPDETDDRRTSSPWREESPAIAGEALPTGRR